MNALKDMNTTGVENFVKVYDFLLKLKPISVVKCAVVSITIFQ